MKVVGIGASAGGMEALIELLSVLPTDSGATWVIISHLSPNHPSILDDLLRNHTAMPVSFVKERATLKPNHIYLNPPGKNLVFSKGMIFAKPIPADQIPNLPIDLFLHSLAEDRKGFAIAVILSGTGADGSRGIRTIKEEGGLVFIQSPESAVFDGMPLSAIHQNVTDEILSPKEIALKLVNILKQPHPEAAIDLKDEDTSELFKQIIFHVSDHTKIDYSVYREPTLIRRMENRMMLKQIKSLKKYLKFLENNPHEVLALNDDFLIGVTRFFRDPEAFEEFENNILPKIFANREEGDLVRFWVSGCSTGEEAYSMAILIDQFITQNNLKVNFKLFASDVDPKAIRIATDGAYPYNMASELPSNVLVQYFQKSGNLYHIKPYLKDKILFAVHNLLSDPPFIQMDFISCRNLLIYLKPQAQKNVLSTFHFALNPSGFLFLGPSEGLGEVKQAFHRTSEKWKFFIKGDDLIQAPYTPWSKLNLSTRYTLTGNKKNMEPSKPTVPKFKQEQPDPYTQYLVEQYAPVSIFITAELDILYINGNIEELVRLPRAVARLNLERMIDQDQLIVFRNGVQKALASPGRFRFENVVFSKNDKKTATSLTFSEVALPGHQDQIVLVQIKQSDHLQDDEDVKETNLDTSSFNNDHVKSLQQQLDLAKQETRQLVAKLESTNEELISSNQELLSANEELQSTNEELQSVNEELYTVNSELQSKNDALITANNDISNLLRSTEIGTIFLDLDLNIRKFTPAIRKQFDLIESDIGRPISTFSSAFNELDIRKICAEVYETLTHYESEVIDVRGNHFLLRVLPYRTGESVIDGVVVSFIDINEVTRFKSEMAIHANKFKAIFNYSKDIIIVLAEDGKIRMINKPFGQFTKKELAGQNIRDFLPKKEGQQIIKTLGKMIKEQKAQNITISISNDQNLHWYEVNFIPTADSLKEQDKITKATVILHDVTEMILSQARLQQTLEEFQAFMDHAQHQISLVDEQGKIHYINFTRHTGLSKEEIRGTLIYDFLPKDQHQTVKEAIEAVFAGKAFGRVAFRFEYPDGRHFQAELIASPVTIDGEVKYAALIGQPGDQPDPK